MGPTDVVELDAEYGMLEDAADVSPEVVDDGYAELSVDDADVRMPLNVNEAELPVPVSATTVEFEAVG